MELWLVSQTEQDATLTSLGQPRFSAEGCAVEHKVPGQHTS